MIHSLSELKTLVKELAISSPEILMMSRFDCHQVGLHSIVLKKDIYTDSLTRVYFTDGGHSMYLNNNPSEMSLGVHNHLYDVYLHSLYGEVSNIEYKPSKDVQYQKLYKYYFHSGIKEGSNKASVEYLGVGRLHKDKTTLLNHCDPLKLTYKQLHTIYVPKGKKACWVVREGKKVKDFTTLYSPLSEIDLDIPYRKPYSVDEVVNYVETF